MDARSLLDRFRFQLADRGKSICKTDALAMGLLNSAYRRLVEMGHKSDDSGWFREKVDIPFVRGRQRYPLPSRTRAITRIASFEAGGRELGDIHPARDSQLGRVRFGFPFVAWRFEGPYLRIEGDPDASTTIATMRLSVDLEPADLSFGKVEAYTTFQENDPPVTGPLVTRGRITLPGSPDVGETTLRPDYYRNNMVRLVEGPGADEEQPTRAFAVATRFLDTEAAFATPPTANTIYAFVPLLPENFHDLIVYEAVHIALASTDNKVAMAANEDLRRPRLQEFREALDRRQSAESAGVNVTQEVILSGEI